MPGCPCGVDLRNYGGVDHRTTVLRSPAPPVPCIDTAVQGPGHGGYLASSFSHASFEMLLTPMPCNDSRHKTHR